MCAFLRLLGDQTLDPRALGTERIEQGQTPVLRHMHFAGLHTMLYAGLSHLVDDCARGAARRLLVGYRPISEPGLFLQSARPREVDAGE